MDRVKVTMLVDVPEGMEGIDVDIARAVSCGFVDDGEGFILQELVSVEDVYPVFQVEYQKLFEVRAPDEDEARRRTDALLVNFVKGAQEGTAAELEVTVDNMGF